MILFHGRCKLRVLVTNKPRPFGLKNYVLTTSDGLLLDFEIYFLDNPAISDNLLDKEPAVILGLAKNVSASSCVYFNRYFNTKSRLREMKLYGTLKIMLDLVLNHKKLDSSKKRGDIVQFTSEDVSLVKGQQSCSHSL